MPSVLSHHHTLRTRARLAMVKHAGEICMKDENGKDEKIILWNLVVQHGCGKLCCIFKFIQSFYFHVSMYSIHCIHCSTVCGVSRKHGLPQRLPFPPGPPQNPSTRTPCCKAQIKSQAECLVIREVRYYDYFELPI